MASIMINIAAIAAISLTIITSIYRRYEDHKRLKDLNMFLSELNRGYDLSDTYLAAINNKKLWEKTLTKYEKLYSYPEKQSVSLYSDREFIDWIKEIYKRNTEVLDRCGGELIENADDIHGYKDGIVVFIIHRSKDGADTPGIIFESTKQLQVEYFVQRRGVKI